MSQHDQSKKNVGVSGVRLFLLTGLLIVWTPITGWAVTPDHEVEILKSLQEIEFDLSEASVEFVGGAVVDYPEIEGKLCNLADSVSRLDPSRISNHEVREVKRSLGKQSVDPSISPRSRWVCGEVFESGPLSEIARMIKNMRDTQDLLLGMGEVFEGVPVQSQLNGSRALLVQKWIRYAEQLQSWQKKAAKDVVSIYASRFVTALKKAQSLIQYCPVQLTRAQVLAQLGRVESDRERAETLAEEAWANLKKDTDREGLVTQANAETRLEVLLLQISLRTSNSFDRSKKCEYVGGLVAQFGTSHFFDRVGRLCGGVLEIAKNLKFEDFIARYEAKR